MEKEKFSLSRIHLFIVLIFSFVSFQSSFAQCTNPDPTGDTTQTFCKTENSTISNLTASGGTIAWYNAATGGNQYNTSEPLLDNTIYYADNIENGNCSPNRLAVTVEIYGDVPSNVDVFVGKCAIDNPTIADLSATGSNIAWYDDQTGGNLLSNTDSLEDGFTYWVEQTENGCTSERLPTVVTIINPPSPTVVENQSFCSSLNPTIADLKAAETNILWYNSETSSDPLNVNLQLIDGEDYWATQSTFPCESLERVKVIVSIDTAPNAGTNGSFIACESELTTTNLFELLGGSPDNTGTWSGPSTLSGGYLGTFEPGVNTNGTYTYSVPANSSVCSIATSNVTVTISTTPSPTTTETTQTFCEVDNPTVANLSAEGNNIVWYSDENSTTPLNSEDALVNGANYWATQTDASGCESATRLVVTTVINSQAAPTTTATSQTFCEIDNPTVANLSADGEGILWYSDENSTTPLNETDSLINGEDYWATQTDASGCESATRLVVTAVINSQAAPTTTETSQTFCEVDNPTVANLSADGEGILWYSDENSTTPLNSEDSLVNGANYWATQTDASGCESATRLVVTAVIISQTAPTTTETTQTFCEVDNPTVANLSAEGNNIVWYSDENSTTPLNETDSLINGEDYWASQTDASGCESATRLVVTAVIISQAAPTTTETSQTFCEVDNPTVANLSAEGNNIVWYSDENSTTPLNETDSLINGEDYWATQTDASGCESATRLVVTAVINSQAAPTTTETSQTFCEVDNPTVANLSAEGNNIVWYSDQNSTTPLNETDSLINGEDYWASQTDASGCESATRLVVTAVINSQAAPTTTETSPTFCEVDNPTIANLSAEGNNIVWYSDENSTTPLNETDLLINEANYWATQTDASGCESATRLVVTAVINSQAAPTTTETSQTFCEVDNPTVANLSAEGNNIVWYSDENSTTPLNETDLLINGEDYWASQTDASGCESATRLVVKAVINSQAAPTTTETSQTFCEVDNPTVANLSADGNNIVWYSDENSTTPLNSEDALINGANYWATQTDASGCESATRLVVTAVINSQAAPTTTETSQTFCEVDNPTVTNLSADGNNIVWYSNENSTTPLNETDLLINGEDYWATQTDASGCESGTRLVVTAVLNSQAAPTTTETSQTFCEIDNPTIANLSADGNNILWYSDENSTTPLNETDLLINGEDYWASQTDASGCESATRLVVTAVINSQAAPTTTETSQTFCEVDNPTVANLSADGNNIVWYSDENSTTPLNETDLLINGHDYWATQTDASGCESATRLVVTALIISQAAPTTTETSQTFCEVDNPTVANLSADGEGILWYSDENSTTPLNETDLLINGEDYWATQTDASGCGSTTRLVVTVIINSQAAPTTTETSQTFCEVDNPTVANLSADGEGILWYTDENSTTPLNETDLLINGEDYWATQTDASGCGSATRLVVTAVIISQAAPTTTETSQTFCEVDNPTVANLSADGNNIVWYSDENSTTPLNETDLLINGANYWTTQTEASGCESATRLVVTAIINSQAAPTTTETSQTFCEVDNPTVANLSADGNNIIWYSDENSTTPLNSEDALINGANYWATQTNTSGCESATRLVVTAIIITAPTTSEINQVFCETLNPTVEDLNVIGNGIVWYETETSTTPLNLTDPLVNGENYWASQTGSSGCESISRLMVTVTITLPLPPTSTELNQIFCESQNPTVADLNVSGTGIFWYDTETSSSPLDTTEPLKDGEDYWATQTENSGCESTSRLMIKTSITATPPPTIIKTSQTFCKIDNPTVANLSAEGEGILWYSDENSSTPLDETDLLINGANYWASQTNASDCESTTRSVVTASVISPPPPTTSNPNFTFCLKDYPSNAPTISELNVLGNNVLWYAAENSTTPLNLTDSLINGANYWASQTNDSGCESTERLLVNVNLISIPTATTSEVNQTFCSVDKPTIANLQTNENSILWFDNENSTTALNETDLLINGEDYWALNYDETTGCESVSKLKISVTILDIPKPEIEITSQVFCASDSPTIADLQTSENIVWYASETDNTVLNTSDLLINDSTYWAAKSETNGCESSKRTAVNVTLTDTDTPILKIQGNEFCNNFTPTISDLNINVTSKNNGLITWYDSFPNGNLLNPNEHLIDGETYYAIETNDDGCSSSNPLEVTVDLTNCDEYEIEIYDGFSPSGNGINDSFKIKNLRELYPNFKVEFFNRWGNLVYTSNISKPDWNGRLNGNDELAPVGIYYFIIYFNKDNKKPIQRRLYLSR